MELRALGRTSLRVSVLGFGAAPLGNEYGALDAAEGERAVQCAIDHGINFFDVSPYYGRTLAEERLGRALLGRREQVVLATKVGRYDRDPPHGFDFSAANVARSVEESLRRLRTDVIDLYLAHDIEFAPLQVILHETLPAMRRLREQGKVRFVGVTGFPVEMLRDAALAGGLDAVLSYCHHDLLNTRLNRVIGGVARELGTGLINASPLHMGALTRHGPPPWHPAPAAVLRAAREAAEWCAARGLDLAEVALRFALDNPLVHSTLVGMGTVREVLADVRAVGTVTDAAVLAELRAMLASVQDAEWPSGLPENHSPLVPDGGAGAG